MTDKEKVVKGLESCIANNCRDCPYPCYCEYADDWPHELHKDILKLLKELDAENGDWITIWQEDDTTISARCSICNRISERPLGGYCKWCGAKMNQEWGVDG